jgi:NitT/TauT family transport system permease protein
MKAILDRPGAAALLLTAILLVLWQVAYRFAGKDALSPPIDTIVYLVQQLGQPEFRLHIWATGQAFFYALAIAVAGGLLIGLVTGLSATAAETAEPLLLAANAIPKVALYPVVLLLFGIGLPAKVAFGAIHGVIPVAIFTMNACRGIPPILLKTARVLRLQPADRIGAILLPAALPDIVTGVRLGFSLTLIGTILGEMFGAQSGLGYLLMTAIGLANTQVIMAVTLLLVVIAATVSSVLLAWERSLRARRSR